MASRNWGKTQSKQQTAPRAVVYARVSSKEQEKEGFSISRAVEALKRIRGDKRYPRG